ncbi:MAG: adenosylcobinamide-GDP ribazoletransferase, partial [Pseudomonadota bacterium]
NWAKSEFFTLVLAIQFLTRLPVSMDGAFSPERQSASVRHYPLVGVFIGLMAAGVFWGLQLVFPLYVSVILSTGLTVLLTGAFHEDGLADTFDGVGGGLTPQRTLEIMKDSRIGTYGTLALIVVLVLKVGALSALSPVAVVVCLIAGHGLSRWSAILVIASSNYVRDEGTGKPTAEGIDMGPLIYASVTGFACIALIGIALSPAAALAATLGLLLGHIFLRLVFERKIGGYTGDCLGATQQSSELGVYLGVLACL